MLRLDLDRTLIIKQFGGTADFEYAPINVLQTSHCYGLEIPRQAHGNAE
jgi:hypothetical protein